MCVFCSVERVVSGLALMQMVEVAAAQQHWPHCVLLQLVLELLIWDTKAYFHKSCKLCQKTSWALFFQTFFFSNTRAYLKTFTWPLLLLSALQQYFKGFHIVRAVVHESLSKKGRKTGRVFSLVSWAAVSFLPCWQIPIFTLSVGAVGIEPSQMWWKWMLVKVVYRREQATVTLLSQAWNLSGTFLSPTREWGGNRGLCELVLIQSDQRVSVQHC